MMSCSNSSTTKTINVNPLSDPVCHVDVYDVLDPDMTSDFAADVPVPAKVDNIPLTDTRMSHDPKSGSVSPTSMSTTTTTVISSPTSSESAASSSASSMRKRRGQCWTSVSGRRGAADRGRIVRADRNVKDMVKARTRSKKEVNMKTLKRPVTVQGQMDTVNQDLFVTSPPPKFKYKNDLSSVGNLFDSTRNVKVDDLALMTSTPPDVIKGIDSSFTNDSSLISRDTDVDVPESRPTSAKSEEDVRELRNLLQNPVRVLMLGGYEISFDCVDKKSKDQRLTTREKVKFVLLKIYRMFISLLHLSNVIRLIAFCAQHVPTADDSTLTMSIEALFFMFYGTAIYFTNHFSMRIRFPKLMINIVEYSQNFGFLSNLKDRHRFVTILARVVLIDCFLYSVIWTSLALLNDADYILYPLNTNHKSLRIVGYIDFAVAIFFLGIPIFGFGLLFTALVHTIVYEFEQTREMVFLALKDNDVTTEARFDHCRERHQALCEMVFYLSRLNRMYVVLTLFFDMVITCLSIYGVTGSHVTTSMMLTQIYYMIFSLLRTVFLIIKWGQLHYAAHSICSVLNRVTWCKLTPTVLQKMNLVLAYCSTTKIGIDVFGLFVMDKTTLVMVFGTLVTYGVVVLQFQLGKRVSVTCPMAANSTT